MWCLQTATKRVKRRRKYRKCKERESRSRLTSGYLVWALTPSQPRGLTPLPPDYVIWLLMMYSTTLLTKGGLRVAACSQLLVSWVVTSSSGAGVESERQLCGPSTVPWIKQENYKNLSTVLCFSSFQVTWYVELKGFYLDLKNMHHCTVHE